METIQHHAGYADGSWGQIHYRIAPSPKGADAAPLIMLHPTPKSGWIYEALMERLAIGRTTIAPDTPGYGASAQPPEMPSIEDYANEMFVLIDKLVAAGKLPAGPVDVIGYHTGSVTAVAMSKLRPDRVRRIILVSLAAYSAEQREERRAGLKFFPTPKQDGSHLMGMWDLLGRLCDDRVSTDWKHASLTENLRPGARAPWGYNAVYGYDLQTELETLVHPTLILNPEDDLYVVTQANAPRAKGAQYIELPGHGHGLFDLETDGIAKLVEEFLS